MSLTKIPGGMWIGDEYLFGASTITFFASPCTIDATGEKFCMMGRFWHPSGGTRNIRKLQFRTGSIVTAGGSLIDVSLQNVADILPDGTQDQLVGGGAININTFTNSAWNTTGNLNSDRTVTQGDLLAVVWEFNGTRQGSDALVALTLSGGVQGVFPCTKTHNGTSWSNPSTGMWPNLLFECDDGSLAKFDETIPATAVNGIAYHVDSAADEYALPFTVPLELEVDAAKIMMTCAGVSSDFECVLYEGTTALKTVASDGNAIANWHHFSFDSPRTLVPGTQYYLALKPTTANTVTFYYWDVADAAHLALCPGGTDWLMSSRVGGGSWSNYGSSLRRAKAALRVSKIHNTMGRRARTLIGV